MEGWRGVAGDMDDGDMHDKDRPPAGDRAGGHPPAPAAGEAGPDRLLVTGAAGNMGQLLRPLLRRPGRTLRLSDVAAIDDPAPDEEIFLADLTDAGAVDKLCRDVRAVLHLGGISRESGFDDVLAVNIVGTHHVLRAAVAAGVRRVILASSNHAVGFHSRHEVPPDSDGLPDELPARPDTFYGWSKAAIEPLGALYHSRYGIDVTVLRIGSCFERPPDVRSLSTWLSPRDAAGIIETCLASTEPGFRVVWGVSANTRRWWSLSGVRELGYQPADDAERFAGSTPVGVPLPDEAVNLVGGGFCVAPLGVTMT